MGFGIEQSVSPNTGLVNLHVDETLVLDYDKWGPILGYTWYFAGTGGADFTVTEGVFLPC